MNLTLLQSLSRMAWRNLRRNFRRNLATGVAITAGFTAFLLAAGYASRVESVLRYYTIYGLRTGHVTIQKKGSLEMYAIKPRLWSLDENAQSKITTVLATMTQIEKSGRLLKGQGLIGNGCKTFPFIATGVDLDVEQYAMTHPELLKWTPHITKLNIGRPIWEAEANVSPVAVSIGLAKLLGKSKTLDQIDRTQKLSILDCSMPNVRDHFSDDANVQLASGTWDGQLNASDSEMMQLYSTGLVETNSSSIVLSMNQLQSLYNTKNIASYSVWLKDAKDTQSTINTLNEKLGDFANELEILPWNEERIGPYYVGTMRFIVTMVGFIGCVLALVIILSIFNSATMTVIERSEEVGMLRSIGYTRGLVRLVFVLEGFFLTVVSTVFGIIVGLTSMFFVNRSGITFRPPGVEGGLQLILVPNFWVMILATVCVSSLAVFATWIAVSGISKKNISELVAGTHR
ncbi:MAG: FtsX-like permease family protein [Proteobacteria bacterium]|nr:FtsX-like permease family protein [Pseudomonadota bacterium]